MTPRPSFADLSDEQLIAEVKRLAAIERRATAMLIRALIELDTRRLYLGEGYSSLFTCCTQALSLAEGAAYNRIETARAASRFPTILEGLEDGALTLTAIRLLAPHLTVENHAGVLASARHKRKHAIEELVASLNPKPAVPAIVRKLPAPPRREQKSSALDLAPTTSEPSPFDAQASRSKAIVAPLAPEQFKVQLTISRDTRDKRDRVQALARHAIPDGDLATIFDRALTLLLNELERRGARWRHPHVARAMGDRTRGESPPRSSAKYGDVMADGVRSSDAKVAARSEASWNTIIYGPTPLEAPLQRQTSSFDAERITRTKLRCSLGNSAFTTDDTTHDLRHLTLLHRR